MTTIELEEIKLARETAQRQLDRLRDRESEIHREMNKAHEIAVADKVLLKEDITESEVNYVLGHSAGYVNGFKAAIDTIVSELSNEYRDIPITEHELYMLIGLGEMRDRAWLRDFKSKEVAEKSGWEFKWENRTPIWQKKAEDGNEDSD